VGRSVRLVAEDAALRALDVGDQGICLDNSCGGGSEDQGARQVLAGVTLIANAERVKRAAIVRFGSPKTSAALIAWRSE
jgi:hypothetical protein